MTGPCRTVSTVASRGSVRRTARAVQPDGQQEEAEQGPEPVEPRELSPAGESQPPDRHALAEEEHTSSTPAVAEHLRCSSTHPPPTSSRRPNRGPAHRSPRRTAPPPRPVGRTYPRRRRGTTGCGAPQRRAAACRAHCADRLPPTQVTGRPTSFSSMRSTSPQCCPAQPPGTPQCPPPPRHPRDHPTVDQHFQPSQQGGATGRAADDEARPGTGPDPAPSLHAPGAVPRPRPRCAPARAGDRHRRGRQLPPPRSTLRRRPSAGSHRPPRAQVTDR